MLVSTPPVNSHQLTNSLTSSNSLHSSLPSSFSTSSLIKKNPCLWSVKEVEEWLIKHNLNDCIDLICFQHHMTGQRLMNLNEDDVLQLKGTNKNNQLWLEIKRLQQFYASNYHIWTQQLSTFHQQSLPITPTSYSASSSSSSQASIPLRPIPSSTQNRSISSSLNVLPPPSNPLTQSILSPSHTTILINQNQEEQQKPLISSTTNQTQTSTPTTLILERSPLTITRSTNNQRNTRRSTSRSLSTSNTSINILPSSTHRPTNALLHPRHTPADEIEDQPITGCCFIGTIRSDRKKTLSACLLALCTLYFCSFIITIVDERLPDPRYFPPLPDLILDNVKQIPWAFSVTEKILLIEVLTLIAIIIFHRHR
jgi:hypothetical protein